MTELPELPTGFSWREVGEFKIVFRHDATGKSYGVRTYGPDPLGGEAMREIAYGIAKIEREIDKDRAHFAALQTTGGSNAVR